MTDDRRRPSLSKNGPSIADLLRRMAEGEEAALEILYDRWAERVHTAAFWILQDRDEAEDVVEETFWQAWRSAGQYDAERSSGSTWLMMIARSRALDRLRTQRRRAGWIAAPSTTSVLLEEVRAHNSAMPDSGEGKRDSEVAAALVALPPEQRQVIELAFLRGLSHSEIASETDQPLGTIKTRIRLGMQKLRESLASFREDFE
jgi:RNA polymerase sigma-70 factor, ECF subfamily